MNFSRVAFFVIVVASLWFVWVALLFKYFA